MDFTWLTPLYVFNLVAGVSSIVGLGVTLKVARDVHEIHRDFLRKARLPEALVQLGRFRSDISQLLSDIAQNGNELRQQLAALRGLLRSLRKYVSGDTQKRLDALGKAIDELKASSSMPAEDAARHIHLAVAELESELDNISKDDKWSGR